MRQFNAYVFGALTGRPSLDGDRGIAPERSAADRSHFQQCANDGGLTPRLRLLYSRALQGEFFQRPERLRRFDPSWLWPTPFPHVMPLGVNAS